MGSRLAPGPVIVDFVNSTKLVVGPGMTGATGNIYVGLQEFDDMAFVLHFLRPGDAVADVGANIGSYSVLSAAAGAEVVAFEPFAGTFEILSLNLAVNSFENRVRARQAALGREPGLARFTTALGAMNHVATSDETGAITEVPIMTLDGALDRLPTLIKIDVEGYETDVIAGGERTLAAPELQVVIMELNGSGDRYGYDEAPLHARMVEYGFRPYVYDGLSRRLTALGGINPGHGNTLYVRDPELTAERVRTAPTFTVLGKSI